MEVTAVLEALRANEGPVEVWSDSTYVVNCFRDRWWQGWLRRNWRNSAGKPVANRDLWEPLIELYLARADALRFRWVKGHHVDPVNAFVDERAVEASRTLQGATGTGAPQRG
jgi:ribonuclease HI